MSDEQKQILERISQLAGQINRHKNKNQQHGATTTHHSAHHRFSPYHGRGGTYRVSRPPTASRHRTLVLNSPAPSLSTSTPRDDGAAAPSRSESETPETWVHRNDRHLQLINSDIYEKDSQARARAMAASHQTKTRARDVAERARLADHFSRTANRVGAGPATPVAYEIQINGIPFSVTKNGAKLVKIPGRITSDNPTPKTAIVGGVRFHRSKNGNLYRSGVVRAQRHSGKKIDEQCKKFSTTGSCPNGPRCRYVHDAAKVAICKDFVKGSCPFGDGCDLSHDPTPQRMPTCLHFARGNCTNANCAYAHSAASAAAPLCTAFGYTGYCDKGAACEDRHVLSECPDFTNTGKCNRAGCKLLHRERASMLRKSAGDGGPASGGGGGDGGANDEHMFDVSSDEEAVDSDDVDSDEAEEFIGANGEDTDFGNQKDFIAF